MFRQMPVILLVMITTIIFFGNFIPIYIAQIMLGISISIKSLIIFFLPVIIFGLLYRASVSLAKDASKIVLLIFVSVIVSNFTATTFSQFIGMCTNQFDANLILPQNTSSLTPIILFELPSLLPNYIAILMGVLSGILSTQIIPNQAEKLASIFRSIIKQLLVVITSLIPLFVSGFVIKLHHDGLVVQIVQNYTIVFSIIIITQICYVGSIYLTINKFNIKKTLITIRNMLPAVFSGFCTMSSIASMPLALIGTERNAQNKYLVHTIVPSTINVHLIGDCIAIPILVFAILKNYGLDQPDIWAYFIFTIHFVLAKFSVAAIPGGGIIVMLPILEKYLGFNTEMLSLITALYILFDPIITSTNVLGNGALARIIDIIIYKRYGTEDKKAN